MKITVFGAGGATGREVVTQAVAKGHDVRASEFSFDGVEGLPEGIERVEADVLSDDLRAVVAGSDAVLSCLGVGNDLATLSDPPPLYTDGTRGIVAAMAAERISRLIVISATFLDAPNRGPVLFRLGAETALAKVFDQMEEMERILRDSDLDWTAVRPGWLMDGPATGDYAVRENAIPPGLIRARHADVADLMLTCAETGDWSRKTPAIAREEDGDDTSSLAVLREMLG